MNQLGLRNQNEELTPPPKLVTAEKFEYLQRKVENLESIIEGLARRVDKIERRSK